MSAKPRPVWRIKWFRTTLIVVLLLFLALCIAVAAGGILGQYVNNMFARSRALYRFYQYDVLNESFAGGRVSYAVSDIVRFGTKATVGKIIMGCMGAFYAFCALAFWGVKKNQDIGHEDERGFEISSRGTMGTARWMNKDEAYENFEIGPAEDANGIIIGIPEWVANNRHAAKKNIVACLDIPPYPDNRHVFLFGPSGRGKSRGYVRPLVMQCVKRGESMVVTDVKGELYRDTCEYLEENGYTVRVFCLLPGYLQYSDGWDVLAECKGDTDKAGVMADTIIRNTKSSFDKDLSYWDENALTLLTALIIYFQDVKDEDKIGDIFKYLATHNETNVRLLFGQEVSTKSGQIFRPEEGTLTPSDAARRAANSFLQTAPGSQLAGNILNDLTVRLAAFNNETLCTITGKNEIDLDLPVREKCAYFVIMSETQNIYSFLSSLFFTFLFDHLYDNAKKQPNGYLEKPVNIILDEFPNIGVIQDFPGIASTARGLNIRLTCCCQSLSQMQTMYPQKNEWQHVVGNFNTLLCMGTDDQFSAEYVSKLIGKASVKNESFRRHLDTIRVTDKQLSNLTTETVVSRDFLTPDEVRRIGVKNMLVLRSSEQPIRFRIYSFTQHPDYKKLKGHQITHHVPAWRQNAEREATTNAIWETLKEISDDQELSRNKSTAEPQTKKAEKPKQTPEPTAETQPEASPQQVHTIQEERKVTSARRGRGVQTLITDPITGNIVPDTPENAALIAAGKPVPFDAPEPGNATKDAASLFR